MQVYKRRVWPAARVWSAMRSSVLEGTEGSFFREVAVSEAPQEGEIEVAGGLFVSLLLW